MILPFLTLLLAGCPWVSQDDLDRLADADGDLEDAVQYGGDDCDDDDTAIVDCDLDDDDAIDDALGGDDCDDGDSATHPGAPDEVGDGVDQNCDDIDGIDADGDGHASVASGGLDCDDGDEAVYPGAPDPPSDGLDANCDGADGNDDDRDGHLSIASGGDDCDDTRDTVYPGAPELCDDLDNDCDSLVDDDDPNPDGAPTWYVDADGDGYGEPSTTLQFCEPGPGWAATSDDCDDLDPDEFPGQSWYYDGDGDGYGVADQETTACEQPTDTALMVGDCNDADDNAYPGATIEMPSGSYATLSDAVDAACDGNTITLGEATYPGTVDFGTRFLTLEATGDRALTIVDGEGLGPVITLERGELIGLTITHGETLTGTGGGILASGPVTGTGLVTISDCLITENVADDGGGVAVKEGANVVLQRSELSSNRAWANGGGLFVAPQARETVRVEDCVFIDNEANSGGGIGHRGDERLTVERTSFQTNTGEETGGLVSAQDVDLDTVTFVGNVGTSGHGGLWLEGSGSLVDVVLDSNSSGASMLPAGAINGPFSVTNLTVTGHSVVSNSVLYVREADVDGLYVYGNSGADVATLDAITLRGAVLYDNQASNSVLQIDRDTAVGWVSVFDNDAPYAVDVVDSGGVALDHLTIVGNTGTGLNYQEVDPGAAAHTHLLIAHNEGWGVSHYQPTPADPALTDLDLFGNAQGGFNGVGFDPTTRPGYRTDDPRFMRYSAALPSTEWDLHLHPTSTLVDAGSALDPDGSPSDIGAHGGNGADFSYYADLDADTLYDGWEQEHGLDTALDDRTDDLDSDGLTNQQEFDLGTRPDDEDTDGDGQRDDTDPAPLDPGS